MFWMNSKLENESKLAAYRLRRWRKTKQKKKVSGKHIIAHTLSFCGCKDVIFVALRSREIHQPKAQDSNDQSLSEYSKEEYQTNNNNSIV